jgi:lantibiotic modifying enzyme
MSSSSAIVTPTLPRAAASPPSSWTPILSGADAGRAEEAIAAIAHDLRAVTPASLTGCIAQGASGLALFFAYLAEARDDDAALGEAEQWLDRALQRLATYPHSASFLSGYTGVVWTALHLCGMGAADDVCTLIDGNLESHLATPLLERHYDLVFGLVGIGTYLLAAPPSERRAGLLETVLCQLEQLAVADRTGLSWYTRGSLLPEWQREICPDGYFNLGLAHGVPGVIALLSRMLAANFESTRVRRLLEGSMRWMLDISSLRSEGRYPSWLGKHAGDESPARAAWCYGDAGIAPALLHAARSGGRPDWYAEAVALSRLVAARPVDRAGVCDGGLCHGSSGLAHIHNRLYHSLGEPASLEAARLWFRHLLDFRRPGEGIGGFLALDQSPPSWHPSPGLLMGSAGVGLALLAATSSATPHWDRSLLIDL